jgi:hypothetical protein
MASNDIEDEIETNGAISLLGYKKGSGLNNPSSEEEFEYGVPDVNSYD